MDLNSQRSAIFHFQYEVAYRDFGWPLSLKVVPWRCPCTDTWLWPLGPLPWYQLMAEKPTPQLTLQTPSHNVDSITIVLDI